MDVAEWPRCLLFSCLLSSHREMTFGPKANNHIRCQTHRRQCRTNRLSIAIGRHVSLIRVFVWYLFRHRTPRINIYLRARYKSIVVLDMCFRSVLWVVLSENLFVSQINWAVMRLTGNTDSHNSNNRKQNSLENSYFVLFSGLKSGITRPEPSVVRPGHKQ